MRGARAIGFIALALLISHVALTLRQPQPSIPIDLYLYHAVALFIILAVLSAPRDNSTSEILLITVALVLWSAASALSTASEFYGFATRYPDIAYSLFYPFMFLAIPRIVLNKKRLSPVEVIDSAIIGLGLCSIFAALLLTRILPTSWRSNVEAFFALFNTVGDLVLLGFTISITSRVRWNGRIYLFVIGILLFAASDLLFFWRIVNSTYSFGDIGDDGWLVGMFLIASSLYLKPHDEPSKERMSTLLIALSVTGSAALLALIALNPNLFPQFIVAPIIATLVLAFIRMAIALREAESLGNERVLARTDELTGLANRRKLIAELPNFSLTEGALLLLDLDGFKPINDKYGHEIGDRVLQGVSQRFHRVLPHGSLLARLGGDEFGALVPGSVQSTFETALALRATLSYPFEIGGESISLGVSIGHVATDGSDNLLQRADAAMYEAKRSGVGVASAKTVL